jgi:hypothetical protein
MRVPAHVIPVHHWRFLGFGRSDEFDGYEFGFAPDSPTKKECEAVAEKAASQTESSLLRRLDEVASYTRKRLRDPIAETLTTSPADAACRWQDVFWCVPSVPSDSCEDPAFTGFGAYPRHPGGPYFGQEGSVICRPNRDPDVPTQEYVFTRAAYRAFFRDAYKQMVEDGVVMLFYAMRLLGRNIASGD